ncbi:MAG: hypothetical protein IPH84_07975 [Bacteroidales bacterium]|nr:hypothetical protein [Bacteroidales bacterium]
MITRLLLPAIIIFSLNSTFNHVFGQTIAVGHISAEVVEAVSASSSISTDFNLVNLNSARSENVALGTIELNSGVDVACNLTLKSASLSDQSGNGFTVEPVATYTGARESQRIDGSQTIELAGKALLASNQASGLYQGSYTLVFAYN